MTPATQTRRRRAMACVFIDMGSPFMVAETPSEVAAMVRSAISTGEPLVELTLANDSEWNGKPLVVRADCVQAVSPPMVEDGD